MIKFGILFFLILNLASSVYADEVSGKRSAVAKMAPMHQVPLNDFKNNLDDLAKTRPLVEAENELRKLLVVAELLKVETISTYSRVPGALAPYDVTKAMVNKMYLSPKWDVLLSTNDLQQLGSDLELIKKSFGEKSYGWAWFLKQNGKLAEAKKTLMDLYEESSKGVLQMTAVYDGNTLLQLQRIQEALVSMCNEAEKNQLEAKMQKMKNHVSNLPNASIMT